MRKFLFTLGLLGASIAPSVAQAAPFTLSFEGLQDREFISNFYNGGTGGNGSGPGNNYGINFSSNSLVVVSVLGGGSGNFSGAPTMPTIAFFLMGEGNSINVPNGFDTGFSLFYSSPFFAGAVSAYSGVNGTGDLLGTINLGITPYTDPLAPTAACPVGPYCPFVEVGTNFSGRAHSLTFTGAANFIGFDNITFGSNIPNPGPEIPEPSTWLLMSGGGLAAAATAVRKRVKS